MFKNSNTMNDDQMKPRSLRFTWSMKTTSTRDPNEIMAEIREVSVLSLFNLKVIILELKSISRLIKYFTL